MSGRVLEGTVVRRSGIKTIKVLVIRKVKHPLYGKFITIRKYYLAHDEQESYVKGDSVRIKEHRPISKRKTWICLVSS